MVESHSKASLVPSTSAASVVRAACGLASLSSAVELVFAPCLHTPQLTCRYFRTRSYFEVDIDIGSSVVAYNTVSLAIGYAKGLVVDMGFCVQVGCLSLPPLLYTQPCFLFTRVYFFFHVC